MKRLTDKPFTAIALLLNRRKTMNTMNVSYFIEKVGHGILNAFLLAALPTALVATLIQAL